MKATEAVEEKILAVRSCLKVSARRSESGKDIVKAERISLENNIFESWI